MKSHFLLLLSLITITSCSTKEQPKTLALAGVPSQPGRCSVVFTNN